jgi:lysyl-tRNA synthetase class 2
MNDKATEVPNSNEEKKFEKKEKPEKYFHPETGVEISKNEFKKLEKSKKKEEEQKKKDEEKKAKMANEPKKEKSKVGANMEEAVETDPTKYLENRKNWIKEQKKKGLNPFPHKFEVSMTIPKFVNTYASKTEKGKWIDNEVQSVAGRVYNIRIQGQGLVFYDLIENDVRLQVYCNAK